MLTVRYHMKGRAKQWNTLQRLPDRDPSRAKTMQRLFNQRLIFKQATNPKIEESAI